MVVDDDCNGTLDRRNRGEKFFVVAAVGRKDNYPAWGSNPGPHKTLLLYILAMTTLVCSVTRFNDPKDISMHNSWCSGMTPGGGYQ